jgi:hypothetical protein
MQKSLLLTDAIINLVLGALLILYPQGLVEVLGMPPVITTFFPRVLGGVLFGIGIALLISCWGGVQGLGLDGAIAINLCGAGVVIGWLVAAPSAIPPRGRVTLWIIALLVIGIGLVELRHRLANRNPL